jgi:DNA-directed RNA polymerase specialized sigma24 family protein
MATQPTEGKVFYLKNADLLVEVIKCKEVGKMSNKLASMLHMLTTRYASKPNFSGYTYIDDMIAEALADLCKNALKFKPERSSNPFAFYTQCIHNSFLGYLNNEKKHRRIRDAMLVEIGENPSFNFQEEYRQNSGEGSEVRNELQELSAEIAEAKIRRAADEQKIADEKALEAMAAESPAVSLLTFDDDEPKAA